MRRVLCLSLLLVACDGEGIEVNPEPRSPGPVVEGRVPVDETPVDPVTHEPTDVSSHLISRYAPQIGVPGVHIRILTMFDPTGCSSNGSCSVTLNDYTQQIVSDVGLLEVRLLLGAETGELCVTHNEVTECGEVFTVLPAPLLDESAPEAIAAGSGDTEISLWGEAFMEDSEVHLGFLPLATTFYSSNHLTAIVPASMLATAGTQSLVVYSPSSGRCGTTTLPLDLVVE